jgi:Uma2 family endonuclease
MGQPAEKLRQATYADFEAVPPHKVAEIINGMLYAMPRPAPPHALASSSLGDELVGPFQKSRGGPGGWWILDEPELHFPNPAVQAGKDVLVPDLAGWRRERMPELPEEAFFSLAPDWVCEVLSKSTEEMDREEKMPIYTREGVRDAWLVDPIARTLEVFVLEGRRWAPAGVHRDRARVRIPPFDAIEIDLAVLWAK